MKAIYSSRRNLRKLLVIGIGTVALLAGGSYWYVFVAGAPQWDRPQTTVADGTLAFRRETFVQTPTGEISAFANVIPEYQLNEITIDLIRADSGDRLLDYFKPGS
ncbi:MAG: hypothetical protein F6K28_39665 [Microcoleus sp. SIO2G3]|nr:hypothetical protein [Microcoleus sp. SIO2G3]